MPQKLLRILPDVLMIALFMLISFAYFQEPVSQGLVLGGHDSDAAAYQGREQQEYRERHDGETSRWTNAMFSGMPTYQIAPSYSATSVLGKIGRVYGLGATGVLLYVFLYLLGFYIMLRAFNFRPYLAALGAIVWAFSSYFFIIIAAGHIWKVLTLAYIPPTIAGLVLCYRGRLVWGAAVTALFTALQVLSNHVQMTYYFLFVMAAIVIAYGIGALCGFGKKAAAEAAADGRSDADAAEAKGVGAALGMGLTLKGWLRATLVIVCAGLLGVAANLPNLYHTYTYSKHTMRGGSELKQRTASGEASPATEAGQGGLEYDYITQWSYGIDETLTLLIPNVKGGGSASVITDENVYDDDIQELIRYAQPVQEYAQRSGGSIQTLPGLNQYWGDQPFTVGPVYVGAFFVFLFFLGLVIVRGPMKWALAVATLISLLFAWGHNAPDVAHVLIDYMPMYNKFRTVSSALVIAEFTIPLLGVLALWEVMRQRSALFYSRRGQIGLAVATLLSVVPCLVVYFAPETVGLMSQAEESALAALAKSGAFDATQLDGYRAAIVALRAPVVEASALRALLVIVLCAGIMLAGCRMRKLHAGFVYGAIALVSLVDMWSINRVYLNADKNFSDPVVREEAFAQQTDADRRILEDKDLDYRVISFTKGNPFNENSTSNWHKNIGGYHAAKLQRYQDLIDRHLHAELNRVGQEIGATQGELDTARMNQIAPVMNMLNARYFIVSDGAEGVVRNPAANGNAWFVRSLRFVKGADAEMNALGTLNTKTAAVADEAFRSALDAKTLGEGTATLTAYEPNELSYDVTSQNGGVVVFSEVYYPGWTATIDGVEAEVGRVNYVLRALRMPAGTHKVTFTFRPASVTTTNGIAFAAIGIILVLLAVAIWREVRASKAA